MKFIVSSSSLQKQLQILGGVVNTNSTLPVLNNFLFTLKPGMLTMSASDLETSITAELDVETVSDGSFAVPAKLLLDILKSFPNQPLTFLAENEKLDIVSSYGKYSLNYFSGDDFPRAIKLQDSQNIHISSTILADAINKTLFASGSDDLRPIMNGVFFKFSTSEVVFVATDAHKLVKYTKTDISVDAGGEFVAPKKALSLLKSILVTESEVSIEYNENNARFKFDNLEVICRLIDGKYPDYESVIPKDNPNELIISRELLLSSIRRLSIFSNKTTHQVRLKLAGAELNMSAEDIDYNNKAEERLTANYSGDDMEIGFNSRFLIEMLSSLDTEDVCLKMSSPERAGILSPVGGESSSGDITMLVMPIMVNH